MDDEDKHRTIQDDRVELGEVGVGSPIDEGEGEDMSLRDEAADEAPAAAPTAFLGGAPVPTGADLGPDDERVV